MNRGQLRVHQRVFRIGIERGLQELAGLFQVPQLSQRAGESQVHAVAQHIRFRQLLEQVACFSVLVFQESLVDQEPLYQQRPAVGQLAQLALLEPGPAGSSVCRWRFLLRPTGLLLITPRQFRFGLGLVTLNTTTQFIDRAPPAFHLAEGAQAFHEQNAEPMFLRPARPQFLRQRCGLGATIPVPVRARQVVPFGV